MMWTWILLAAFIVFILILYLLSPLISPASINLKGAHVVVTGGSSGIGKSLAIEAVKGGAKVTMIARDKKKLEEAKSEVSSHIQSNDREKNVEIHSVDLSTDFGVVEAALKEAVKSLGPVDILVNCAGTAVAGYFEDLSPSVFKKMIDINYISAVNATKAVISGMKSRGSGRVVFVSSQAGQIGLFGYTAYSASKFALRGLAEALQMEVKAHNIYITLAFPPDTDTPGYHEENKTKPKETKLLSETSAMISPESVAQIILKDAVKGRFLSSVGLDGVMLSCLTCGFSPVTSLMEATQQVATMGLFRIISLFYLEYFYHVIRKCKNERGIEDDDHSKKIS